MTDRVVGVLRSHLLHNFLPGAPRNEVTAALNELVAVMESDAPNLTSRVAHRADLVSKITVTAAPKYGGDGPLIKSEHSSRVELALWSTVLPWETSRGLSFISKEVLEKGRYGKAVAGGQSRSDNQEKDVEEDDDLGVISRKVADTIYASSGHGRNERTAKLDGTNGMLFVHRSSNPRDVPHFWSGAIQAPLDVAFLSLPTPPREPSATAGLQRRTGLNMRSRYQRLDQSTPGFGPLDDPLVYSYFLNERTRALAGDETPSTIPITMPLCVEDVAVLEPFVELEEFNLAKRALVGGGAFDGHHMFMDGRAHRCSPSVPRRHNEHIPITAVLEVRKGLFRDAVATIEDRPPRPAPTPSSFSSPQVTVEEVNERVTFTIELGEDLMREMKEKEHLYKDVIETLDRRCAQLLVDCEKPVGWGARKNVRNEEEVKQDGVKGGDGGFHRGAPMPSWKESNNEESSASELVAAAPARPAPSFLGSDGTKKSTYFTSITRYSNTAPEKPSYPPVDVELFCAAYQLSVGSSSLPQLLGRLGDDLSYDADQIDPAKRRLTNEDIARLLNLVRNPAVSLPGNMCVAILGEAAKRDIQ